jgi:Rps23 Pro-64 3,4-dihydroxylase Tpa1-like proline 4-hydroxylase
VKIINVELKPLEVTRAKFMMPPQKLNVKTHTEMDAAPSAFDYHTFRESLRQRFSELYDKLETLSPEYQNGEPFPFIVIDNFLPLELAELISADIPEKSDAAWTRLPTEDQKNKFVMTDDRRLPLKVNALIQELNSGYFLRFLEKLTAVPELIADTKLVGGGLHMIERGGKLSVHVDFSHHPTNGLNRRLNFLLYLNPDWQEEYGGHFELWDQEIKSCKHKILPIFNRCVVFSTSPISYHGHPDPLNCPEGMTRKSIALYYFSKGRPVEEDVEHNTLFKSRPHDQFRLGNFLVRTASSGMVRELVPPVVYKLVRKVWNRRYTGA